MSLFGIVLVIVGIWLAIKLAGAFLKLAMIVLVVVGLWILVGPYVGLPAPF